MNVIELHFIGQIKIFNIMKVLKWIIFLGLLMFQMSHAQNLTDTLNKEEMVLEVSVNVSSYILDDYIGIQVEQVNDSWRSYTVVEATFDNSTIPTVRYPNNYYQSQSSMRLDLEGAQFDFTQYISIKKTDAAQDTLFIFIYNLDPHNMKQDLQFSIRVSQELIQRDCETGGEGRCSGGCDNDKIGPYCDHAYKYFKSPTDEKSTNLDIQPNSYKHVVIENIQNIYAIVSLIKGQADMFYFIKNQRNNEVPGFLNVEAEQGKKRQYSLDEINSKYAVKIYEERSKDIVITFVTYSQSAQIKIGFQYEPFPVWAIVLISLGSFFCCIFVLSAIGEAGWPDGGPGDNQHPRSEQHPRTETNSAGGKRAQIKTKKEAGIEYIPAIPFNILKKKFYENQRNFQSLDDLTFKKQMEQYKHICSICMADIQNQTPVKVCYCGHFFHARCLDGWFKKKKNCPQCRQDHEYSSLKQKYEFLAFKYPEVKQDSINIPISIFKQHHVNL